MRVFLLIGVLSFAFTLSVGSAAAQVAVQKLKTRNVVLIVSDGLRWQEIFTGGDPALMDSEAGVFLVAGGTAPVSRLGPILGVRIARAGMGRPAWRCRLNVKGSRSGDRE